MSHRALVSSRYSKLKQSADSSRQMSPLRANHRLSTNASGHTATALGTSQRLGHSCTASLLLSLSLLSAPTTLLFHTDSCVCSSQPALPLSLFNQPSPLRWQRSLNSSRSSSQVSTHTHTYTCTVRQLDRQFVKLPHSVNTTCDILTNCRT